MEIRKKINRLKKILYVAFFIAAKNIQRGSLMVRFVIVSILMLTFLNLTVVGGLLNGIIDDISVKIKNSFLGDVYIEPLKEYSYIQNPDDLLGFIKGNNDIIGYSGRLVSGATLESKYKELSGSENPNRVRASVAGIDIGSESKTTDISERVIAGKFLDANDWNAIVLGASLTEGYVKGGTGGDATLGYVEIGNKIRLRFSNGITREFTIVGIISTKSSVVDQRAFINYKELQQILGLQDNRYSEITIKTKNDQVANALVSQLKNEFWNYKNNIKVLKQAIPSAVDDVKVAFALIGNIVGAIAVLVGLVTVFVIIFVNASSRRRYLGILKAQGIEPMALVLSYVFQALFFTFVGIILGTALLLGVLQPYFDVHPLSLPMADGRLLLTSNYVVVRIILLVVSAIVSGFLPAWLIVRQNTLNSILGR